MENYILDIQRMSTEDGPGIRTTVFFKGCNLKCRWCHNPESLSFKQQKYWIEDNCIGCFSCLEACPEKAISFPETGMKVNLSLCTFCLRCAEVCPTNSIEVKGEKIAVDTLYQELLKDLSYYKNSSGGVTLSGGEAVLHNDYVLELLKKLKGVGIHTALDTAGHYPFEMLERLLPYVDLILFDLKIFDEDIHKKYTGVGNKRIKENAIKLGKITYPKVWIRTPIIPNSTDSLENIEKLGEFIRDKLLNLEKWELVSFNNLSKDKYRLLGNVWEYEEEELMTKEKMTELCEIAKKYVKNAIWSGATKLEV
ncbi:MAG TPA: glycyl-radical enzyme activating protein [Acholeplasmataceae bacterium]|nr:glycyl-radical enzyme activating protein [Acholeplasmataceae bacterium]